MFAPITYPRLVKRFGLMATGSIAGLWHISTLMMAVVALFLPGSEYLADPETSHTSRQDEYNITADHQTASFWLHCPENQEKSFPESYLSPRFRKHCKINVMEKILEPLKVLD